MKSRTKDLITLTDLDVQSNQPEIAISMTSGLHTLKATTVNQNVWETIGFLACELTMAPPEIRDLIVKGPADLKRFFRFDIDSDLQLKMAGQYSELGDCDLTHMNENIINGFDKVNGNNAVSHSVGIANLAVGISKGEFNLEDEQSSPTWISRLNDIVYAEMALDPDKQGVIFIAERLNDNVKVELNIVHAVGNVFVNGTIGEVEIRVFKSNVIQLFVNVGTGFTPGPTKIFSINDRAGLTKALLRVTSTQIF